MTQLGGHAHFLDPSKIYTPAMEGKEVAYSTERVSDVARVLDRMGHALAIRCYGDPVDWEYGGLYVEGLRDGKPTEKTKEFWQQAEGMVGFLDAYILTKEKKYIDAFKNIHDFVFTKMINWDVGEWLALTEQNGNVIWDYMGTSWKVFYHTVRATSLVIKKLEKILDK